MYLMAYSSTEMWPLKCSLVQIFEQNEIQGIVLYQDQHFRPFKIADRNIFLFLKAA